MKRIAMHSDRTGGQVGPRIVLLAGLLLCGAVMLPKIAAAQAPWIADSATSSVDSVRIATTANVTIHLDRTVALVGGGTTNGSLPLFRAVVGKNHSPPRALALTHQDVVPGHAAMGTPRRGEQRLGQQRQSRESPPDFA